MQVFKRYGLLIIFCFAGIVISIITPNFLTSANLLNLLRQSTVIGIIAVGTTFVIVGAGFDISVGSVLALSAALALGLQRIMPWGLAVILTLSAGMLIGLLNGILVAKVKIISIIATLGTMTIVRGITYLYTGGYPVIGYSESFRFVGSGYIGIIPFPIILLILMVSSGQLVLKKTPLGRYSCALGGNREAARLSGINVDFYQIMTFVIGGLMAALAGIIYSSRLNSATPLAGQGYELDAIAATVIGGTSVSGGKGSVPGSVLGVIILTVIGNMFNLLGVQVYLQYVVKGLIILFVVGIDSYTKSTIINV